jgi:predicted NodU family carbamoyl transferase
MGIHDGHNASVALLRDGRLELALQEERLTRLKNQGDAPAGAARLAIRRAGENACSAAVALNGHYMNMVSGGARRFKPIMTGHRNGSSVLRIRLSSRAHQRRKASDRIRRLTRWGSRAFR